MIWTESQQQAFDGFKKYLLAKPCLYPPDHKLPYVLRTDASAVAVGAVLLQESGNELRVVGYAFKQLLPREQKFSAIERELLAITFGLSHFEQYLFERKVKLQSDHKPLQYLKSLAQNSSRIAR